MLDTRQDNTLVRLNTLHLCTNNAADQNNAVSIRVGEAVEERRNRVTYFSKTKGISNNRKGVCVVCVCGFYILCVR